jgi:heme oxygenase
MHRTARKPDRKEKKSYTLSVESVAFLEDLREKRRARSTSSVLDEIVQSFRRSQRKKALEHDVTQYYSSLSPTEVEDDAAWGEFALGELAKSKR